VVDQGDDPIALGSAALPPGGLHGGGLGEQLGGMSHGLLAGMEIGQQVVKLLAGAGYGVH